MSGQRYQGEYDDVQYQPPPGGSYLAPPAGAPPGARGVAMYDGDTDTEQYQENLTKAIGRDTVGVLASSMGGMALGSIIKPLAIPAKAAGAAGTVFYGGSPHTATMDSRNMRNKIVNARGVDRARASKMSAHDYTSAAFGMVQEGRRVGHPVAVVGHGGSARLLTSPALLAKTSEPQVILKGRGALGPLVGNPVSLPSSLPPGRSQLLEEAAEALANGIGSTAGSSTTKKIIADASKPAPFWPGMMARTKDFVNTAVHGAPGKGPRFRGVLGVPLKVGTGVGAVLAAGSIYGGIKERMHQRGAGDRFDAAMGLLDNDATASVYMEDAARRAHGHFDPELRKARMQEAFKLVDKYAPSVAKDPQLLATYMAKLTPDLGRTLQGDEILKRVDDLSKLEASIRKNRPSLVQDAAPAFLSQFIG